MEVFILRLYLYVRNDFKYGLECKLSVFVDCDPEGKSYLSVTLNDLGPFTKLRKVAISFDMSVCPSVRPSVRKEQLGSHWTDFHEILYLRIFLKCESVIKI
jgi:hypothetical protein